eukprot:3861014-Amphidinium_carterae.1
MHEMLQHPYYDAMQRMLDDVEMDMTEYLQMKQYHKYLIYLILPQDYEPFTANQRKHINEFTEAFNHYSRVLQYILTK